LADTLQGGVDMPIIPHPDHHIEGREALLDHLADQHGYSRDELLAHPTALVVLHDQGHRNSGPIADDPALTPFGFAGRASDALEHAILDLDALRLVDVGAAERLAARFANRLAIRYVGGKPL
jgi:hypothetical protein